MNNKLIKTIYLLNFFFIFSCGSNKTIIENSAKINTRVNSEYKKSRKAYSGVLNKVDYNYLIKKLEEELKSTISTKKTILINYNQKAKNCIEARFSKKDIEQIATNRIGISSRICSNYDAIDFFVYTKDSYNRETYKQRTEFILDSGFFYDNIFTEHENCAGFFIIKPNGEFYKYYGEDYYSEVEAFFIKN